MGDEEIHMLRMTNQQLEHEARSLKLVNQRLEKHATNLRQHLDGERRLSKCLRKEGEYELKTIREDDIKKYQCAMNDLKTRLQVELNRALETQKGQLEKNFRSELMKLVHKKDNQLHLLFTHTQRVKREADKKLVVERLRYEDSYQHYLDKLKQDFQKQLTRLLVELKSKERRIESLQKTVLSISSSASIASNKPTHFSCPYQDPNQRQAKSVTRSKSYRQSRASQHPYNSQSKKRHETMKEIGGTQSVDTQPFYYLHHQYGGSALETLPEGDSEDECSETEDISENGHPATTSCSSQASEEILGSSSVLETTSNCDSQALSRQDSEDERIKIVTLETIICQLRDELRECKDQNELLEFRLLEMEEFGTATAQVGSSRSKVAHNSNDGSNCPEVATYIAEVPAEVTAPADFESTNSHASVAESRSSCSDCSESLSLQESGIFDSQSQEDSYGAAGSQTDISRELVTLTSQIEGLVLRFSEGSSGLADKSEDTFKAECSSRMKTKLKTSQDLAIELQSCRQRIQDFERRLNQFTDIRYIYTLEDKVNNLVRDNQRLQEERTELEESENDSRHQCQRLEEKMVHLRQKKAILQNQLSNEKRFIEQLRMKILQLQEREEDLCSQISRIEALVQSYEQRNFELEESCIEMKCSVQFVVHSIPIFVLCYLWSLLRNLEVESQGRNLFIAFPSSKLNLLPVISPSSLCPTVVSRKHKLVEIPSPEPTLKKLRCIAEENEEEDESETEDHSCVHCQKNEPKATSSTSTQVINTYSQTSDELWKTFVEHLVSIQRKEWKKVEKFLRKKIEFLECDIDKYQEIFDQERCKLVENYESQLAEKEAILKENQECLNEHKILQEKWDNLVRELEQFAVYLGRNLSMDDSSPTGVQPFPSNDIPHHLSTSDPAGELIVSLPEKSNELLFPSSALSLASEMDSEAGKRMRAEMENTIGQSSHTSELISKLLQGFCEQWNLLENREKQLLDENDRLKAEIAEVPLNNCKGRDADKTLIGYLTEENNRLQTLLADQEKVWGRVKELEDDNEKLRTELGSTNVSLRKRLDETQSAEKEMRIRIEELEQSESHWKEMTLQLEKKDKKALERIHQLREEIQFLRNRCCQLQDELDLKLGKENKYKNEIQLISNKLKASTLELEEKENHLESSQISAQAQIAKLRSQLNEVHQQFTDAECSNGMLREEVIYLERTVQEAIEKAATNENMVQVLSSELQQKEAKIEELYKEMCPDKPVELDKCAASNDLDVFAKNEGGLCGVARDVEEVVKLLQESKETQVELGCPVECQKESNTMTGHISHLENELQERDLLESACEGNESFLDGAFLVDNRELDFTMDFRVLRRIGEDALLVSWSIPEKYSAEEVNGYEISVNGNMFLRIPKPNRYKAVLFGLNMNEPLRLSLKCTGAFKLQESTITYIA